MSGRHTSIEKELKKSIKWLESLSAVEKVILGVYESARHHYTPGFLRATREVVGGINLNAYGGNGVMKMFVKVKKENVEGFLEALKDRYAR